jgi:hypothetical protein
LWIFAVAQLTRHPNEHDVQPPLHPICEIAGKKISYELDMAITAHRSKKGRFMKKKSRIEIAREILSYVRREMNKPRLAESVRNGYRALAAPNTQKPAGRFVRA